ncbi:ammonium transporter [Bifidobacterium aemilianum]|uniref:Ammonium transporter n=1 Tax=Bifidobacterium aemilianum TaxID=2493120 RepID=A0A366K775_9BIFI|nr:ammonium transporter [Bifidobacterium aemilianum]RBP97514.1 ammonium transporter [Bifidobacterium aemilianum]
MDSGNAAWMLMAAAMVFLMTPGLAFFYGGMVRAKAVLNMLMMSAVAIAITGMVWTLWGWSIAYAGQDLAGIFGDPVRGFLLHDTVTADQGVFTSISAAHASYPRTMDIAFQMAFAMIAVALISGALAERVKISTWMLFVALWITLDYAPMAHMVWNHGLLSEDGIISQAIGAPVHDFAGGTVIHINSAVSALIIVLIVGDRVCFNKHPMRPHNLPMTMLGAFLLWFGWFGFNSGSALAANGTAGYTWLSTTIAACAAIMGWLLTEKIRSGHYSALGAASGMISGLVAITPSADVVSPFWSMVIGLLAGCICCFACGLKLRLNYDDSLDVVGIHGVGGLLGTILVGFFAVGTGLFSGGGFRQLLVQIIVALVAMLYAAAVTAIIAFALEKTIGWRVADKDEISGIDQADQGESAYEFFGSSKLIGQ